MTTENTVEIARSPEARGSGAEWIKGNPMVVEYVAFERPTAWASIAVPTLRCEGRGADLAEERRSRLMVRTELRPKGRLREGLDQMFTVARLGVDGRLA